jgi:hypothetical protein
LDLAAIRNYVQYAYENWNKPPTYVVLWGTGNYDYRKIEGNPNYIPAYQNQNSNIIELGQISDIITSIHVGADTYSTDDYFTNVDSKDRWQDIAIGRVPISNNAEGNNYINKLDLYENKSHIGNWRRNILMHADDGFSTGIEGLLIEDWFI